VLSRERPIVIIADPGGENESAVRLGRIGFDHVVGYLKDGLRSLESRPDLTDATERLSAPVAAERLESGAPVAVDVRTPRERDEKRVAGSINIPLEPPERTTAGIAEGSAAARLLCWRVPVVDRDEPAEAAGIRERERAGRRHDRLGNGEAAYGRDARLKPRAPEDRWIARLSLVEGTIG
jgi:hypothetical protein